MNRQDFIIIGLVIVNLILIYRNTPKRKLIRSLNRHMKLFAENYEILKGLLDKQFEMPQISEYFGVKLDGYETLPFDFGGIDFLEFRDTREMRYCFLLSGEYIIKLAETLEDNFSIVINSETNEVFKMVMEMLQDVRKNTLMLNEDASIIL